MKKLLLACLICLFAVGMARAEVNIPELINKLPALNQNVIYSISDSKFDYATSVTLASIFSGRVNVDFGYSPSTEALGAMTINLLNLKDWIKFPILDSIVIEPGLYAGISRIAIGPGNAKDNNEFDWGCIVKLIAVKF